MSTERQSTREKDSKPTPISPLHAEVLEPGFSSYDVRRANPELNIREFVLNGDVNTVRHLLKREGIEHGSASVGFPIQESLTISKENFEKMREVLQELLQ